MKTARFEVKRAVFADSDLASPRKDFIIVAKLFRYA
jgi:hypothetical protein